MIVALAMAPRQRPAGHRIAWRLALYALACIAAFASPAAIAAGPRWAPTPGWIVDEPLPEVDPRQTTSDGTRYLLVADHVDLTGAQPAWYRRIAYRVDEERALASGGRFEVEFQPVFQHVLLHSVVIRREGRVLDRKPATDLQVLRREGALEAALLDGRNTLNATIPDVRIGDIVDYSYSVIGANPVFGDAYYDLYTARFSQPLGLRVLRVDYPEGKPMHWRAPRQFSVAQRTDAGRHRLELRATRLARVVEEDDTPADYDPYGRLELSSAASWADIVRWAAPLYAVRFHDRVVAATLVRELRLDEGSPGERLLRAVAYVQGQVRYTGLNQGLNSHAPHAPETVLARRFGDCKDKAVLLAALLHQAGIESDSVLVNTTLGGQVARRLPSGLAFDHVVTRVRMPGGDVWVDATRDREAGPLGSREPLPFGKGLPLCAGCAGLVDIPFPMPRTPQVDVEERITLAERGEQYVADFDIATGYAASHAQAVRDGFAEQAGEGMGRQYLKYMRNFYEGLAQVAVPGIAEIADGGVQTEERYRLDWKRSEGDVFGIVLFQLLDWVPALQDERRHDPKAMSGPRFARQKVATRIDSRWNITPERDVVENAFFRFARTVRVEGEDLVITAEWRRKAEQVPADAYAGYRRDLGKVRDLLQFDVDLSVGLRDVPRDLATWGWPLLAIALAAVVLPFAWFARRRSRLAGMLFAPSSTILRVLGEGWPGTVALLLAAATAGALFEHGHLLAEPGRADLLTFAGGVLKTSLQVAAWALLVRWAFRLFSARLEYARSLRTAVWASSPPSLLFCGLALVAMAGRWTILGDDGAQADATDLPALLVASCLLVTGGIWALCVSVSAYAKTTDTRRGTAVAALLVGSFGALFFLVPLAIALATHSPYG